MPYITEIKEGGGGNGNGGNDMGKEERRS